MRDCLDSKRGNELNLERFGQSVTAANVYLGERLGLYRALAKGGPATPQQLAARTGIAERDLREWLCNQTAAGYVTVDFRTSSYALSGEPVAVPCCTAEPRLRTA